MLDDEKEELAKAIFMQMLMKVMEIGKVPELKDRERCLIVHTAITNFLGAFLAGVVENENIFDEAMAQISEDSRERFLFWRKFTDEQMDKCKETITPTRLRGTYN